MCGISKAALARHLLTPHGLLTAGNDLTTLRGWSRDQLEAEHEHLKKAGPCNDPARGFVLIFGDELVAE